MELAIFLLHLNIRPEAILKIHVLSGGLFVPLLTKKLWSRNFLPCNCLVIEKDTEIHLVDTGLHQRMLSSGFSSQIYNKTLGLRVDRKTSLKGQLEQLKINPEAVKTITLTHLHPDHTSGLIDFPNAEVFVSRKEWEYVNQLDSKDFYKSHFDERHWSHVKKIQLLDFENKKWFGFYCCLLPHISTKAFLIDLPGHTGGGHSGVAIQFKDKWIFHVGDAYFLEDDLNEELGHRHLLSEMVQATISPNTPLRNQTARKIADLKKELNKSLVLISAHEEKYSNQLFAE